MRIFSGTSQGGSVASFLVIGVVLIALAVGGVYFVQQRESETPVEKPGVTTAPAEQKKTEKKQKKSANQTKQKSSNQSDRSRQDRRNTALPQTGPEDSLGVVFASAVLAGFLIAYVRSVLYRFGYVQR